MRWSSTRSALWPSGCATSARAPSTEPDVPWLPDVSRARRVRRADDAVADNGLGLHDAAELGHPGVDGDDAGGDGERTGADGDLCRRVDRDTCGFELHRVAVAVDDLHRPRTVLQRHLLTARRFSDERLLAVLIVERDLDAVARAQHLLVVVAGTVHRFRRCVAAVPQRTDHVRPPRVSAFE